MSKLTLSQRAGYGFGDAGFNLLWSSVSLYLLLYYTDVLGISAATAGAIIMAGMIWDGITDPLMGLLADRTRTRWGRYRPYLLLGAAPLALSFVLMFATPWIGAGGLVLAAAATQILFRTAYTALTIPYSALSARLTANSMERNRLSAMRMIFATVGALFVARYTLEFANGFGDGDLEVGFLKVGALYAVLATLIFWTTFALTREADFEARDAQPALSDLTRMLSQNWPFLLLFAAVLIGTSGGNIVTKALVYYLIYGAGADPTRVGEVIAVFIVTITISIPFWAWLTERTSKRVVWLSGAGISVVALVAFFVAAPDTPSGVMTIMVFHAIGAGSFVLTFWSMLPDTVEYGEWRSSVRGESVVFGLITLSQKVALGLGVGLLGLLLNAIGYTANEAQAPETISGLLAIMTLLPAFLIAGAAALIFFYPIDKARHEQISADIASRS